MTNIEVHFVLYNFDQVEIYIDLNIAIYNTLVCNELVRVETEGMI